MDVKRGTLAVVCLATAVLMLDIAVVNTALPHIASDLNAGLSGLQWVVDAYTLALASVVLTAGSMADRIGRKKVFSVGLVLFTTASIACVAVAMAVWRSRIALPSAASAARSFSIDCRSC